MEHYDVGILGVWFGCNYGSIATYYALEQTIEAMGYRVLMVHQPRLKPDDGRMKGRHSIRFAEEHYQISKSYHVSEISELNQMCDTFVLGSDQIWNYGVTKIFGHSYFLDFADDTKKKIAYATSFGSGKFLAPRAYAKEAVRCMRRMDAISVREAEGVEICRKTFGMEATHVLDPVLMCEPHVLGDLTERSDKEEKEPFIATYILDPTPEKREALLHVSKKQGKKLVNMLDGWYNKFEANKKRLDLDNTIENLQVEDWLYYFKNSDFVITDSFHGTCMAILFHKPFIAIGNPGRGTSRFESLLGTLGLTDRYVADAGEILRKDALLTSVDYTKVDEILKEQREFSRTWLSEALAGVKKSKVPGIGAKAASFWGRNRSCAEYAFRSRIKPLLKKILSYYSHADNSRCFL